jgi:hypothetical protein
MRRKQGPHYRLAAILVLAVVAILANHLSMLAIAEWGSGQDVSLRHTLVFPRGKTSHQSGLQRLFRKPDHDQPSTAVSQAFLATRSESRGGRFGAAIGGKARRERRRPRPECVRSRAGPRARQGPGEHGEDNAEAVLAVAPELHARLARGRVLVGDALFGCAPKVEVSGGEQAHSGSCDADR